MISLVGVVGVVLLLVIVVMVANREPTMATSANHARTVVRRLYFYGVSLVSFIAALAALVILLRVIFSTWLDSAVTADLAYVRNTIAGSGGVLLVAVPIFLLHWRYAQSHADAEERRSGMRKFFLYVASAVSVGYALYYGFELLQGMGALALGEPAIYVDIWPSNWLADILIVACAMALQFYFHRILLQDGDYGTEYGGPAAMRRLYQTLAGLLGLALLILGLGGMVETLLHRVLESTGQSVRESWWRMVVSSGLAQTILGALLLRINWQRWRSLASQYPAEAQSGLRRFYLYASVVAGALAVLVPAAQLVNQALIQLFDPAALPFEFWDAVATAVAYAPVGMAVWLWHGRYLEREADAYGESSEGATVRRLYFYAVAATGLVLLWFGAVDLVQAILDTLLAQGRVVAGSARIWVYPLANGLSLLAVGAPVWAYHWRSADTLARRIDRVGQEERASGPRKVYLYGVALVGALLILFYLARVVYRLLLILMGEPGSALVGGEIAGEVARSIIAAVLWTVHVMAIRRDGQQGAEAPPPLVDVAARRTALEERIRRLEEELAAARAELAALDEQSPFAGP